MIINCMNKFIDDITKIQIISQWKPFCILQILPKFWLLDNIDGTTALFMWCRPLVRIILIQTVKKLEENQFTKSFEDGEKFQELVNWTSEKSAYHFMEPVAKIQRDSFKIRLLFDESTGRPLKYKPLLTPEQELGRSWMKWVVKVCRQGRYRMWWIRVDPSSLDRSLEETSSTAAYATQILRQILINLNGFYWTRTIIIRVLEMLQSVFIIWSSFHWFEYIWRQFNWAWEPPPNLTRGSAWSQLTS